MKNLIKYKNRIYRRYATDLWGQVIMKGKITRMFRYLLRVFNFKLKKLYLKRRSTKDMIKRQRYGRKIRVLNSGFYRRLGSSYKSTLTPKRVLKQKGYNSKYFEQIAYVKLPHRIDKYKLQNFFSEKQELDGSAGKFIRKWKNVFLNNFNNVTHLDHYRSKVKKKISLKKYLWFNEKSTKFIFTRTRRLEALIKKKRGIKSMSKKFRRKRALAKMKNLVYDTATRIASYESWLDLEKKFKAKKFTNWWKLRGAIRKTSIFYGIFSLKKFRYIESSINRKTALKSFFALKLETMINIILFRVNLFSNIYFSNNFIRGGGVLINEKIIYYPFRSIKKNDIICINKIYFKKIFNIFFKKLFFSKKNLIKNNKLKIYNKVNATKILINSPNYLEVNYKILHFIMWRFPNRSELTGLIFSSLGSKSLYDWNISTRCDYL